MVTYMQTSQQQAQNSAGEKLNHMSGFQLMAAQTACNCAGGPYTGGKGAVRWQPTSAKLGLSAIQVCMLWLVVLPVGAAGFGPTKVDEESRAPPIKQIATQAKLHMTPPTVCCCCSPCCLFTFSLACLVLLLGEHIYLELYPEIVSLRVRH